MPKYTLSWISRWIVLGPRQWLVWVLARLYRDLK